MDRFIIQLSNRYAETVAEILNQKQEEKERYAFGAEIFFGETIKLMMFLSIAYVLDIFIPTLITILSFVMLRRPAGGYHADTHLKCAIISIVQFIGAGFVCKCSLSYLIIYHYVVIILCTYIFALYNINKYAPVDTRNKRIEDLVIRKHLKIKAIIFLHLICFIAVIVFYLGNKYCILPICLGVLIETFSLTKFGYKVFTFMLDGDK
jgi:accessory gene regulator B